MKKIAPGTPRFGVLGALDYVRRRWLFGRGRCRRCSSRSLPLNLLTAAVPAAVSGPGPWF